MHINPKEFYANYPEKSIQLGQNILDHNGVVKYQANHKSIFATIKTSDSNEFNLTIQAEYNYQKKENTFSTSCQCKKKQCEHVASAILHHLENGNTDNSVDISKITSELTDSTIKSNTVIEKPTNNKSSDPVYHILYLLEIKQQHLYVQMTVARVLQKGGYGVTKPYNEGTKQHREAKQEIDEKIHFQLSWQEPHSYSASYKLSSIQGEETLKKIIDTDRAFFQSKNNPHLVISKNKQITLKWAIDDHARQFLCAELVHHANTQKNKDENEENKENKEKAIDVRQPEKPDEKSECHTVKVDQMWYIKNDHEIGIASADMPSKVINKLMDIPPIPPQQINNAYLNLKKVAPTLPEPILQVIETEKNYRPEPLLHFVKTWMDVEPQENEDEDDDYYDDDYYDYYDYDDDYEEKEIIAADVFFKYGDKVIAKDDDSTAFFHLEDNVIHQIKRNFPYEVVKENQLKNEFNLTTINDHPDALECDDDHYQSLYVGDEDEAFEFAEKALPKLKDIGWGITSEGDFSLEVFHDGDLEWFSELEESEYDWFGMNLGVIIDGEKINILPLIIQYLKEHKIKDAKTIQNQTSIQIRTPKGQTIIVPTDRFKGILSVLTELYDTESLDKNGNLEMHALSAAQLAELEKIINVDNFSWLGSNAVKQAGDKLKNFESVKEVTIPSQFKAELRPYQQQGVNWLRFLNEFNLGGILADDMGLGKTVQTLACLVIEKENNPQHPSIIISPTSLVANWQLEIEKFAPHLSTLVLHGSDRHQHFENIQQYDIVLTSYPLVLRDEEVLLKQQFNYIILDEAQFIKNHRAKSARVIFQLKAHHKLCLSGTPMENHLGELWSQFRFIAPGLLGSTEKFKRIFRTPIEKHQAIDRRKSLASRIKPFMMRRTKSQVAVDLPPKTEIIKTTALEGKQRDLYESIRSAMDKKVRDAIKKQGLKKSHIIVLDALLKLRQTCCDPKLLSIESAKAAHGHSAKLKLLMDMLPNMVEEGRKIILFSQFTSMIDIIKQELDKLKIKYVTLTGSTKDRKTPINNFQNGDSPIIIISLKAGGVGLNLTAADTVIHYDPWWNPAVENQATDRAHRIGQDKPVFVYKLISEGTVEETIIDMQNKKKDIVEGLLSENQNTKKPLQADDLQELFKPLGNHRKYQAS